MMRNQLTKAIGKIDAGVTKLKSYSFNGMNPGTVSGNDTRKSTATDRFPNVSFSGASMNLNLSSASNGGEKIN